MIVKKLTMQNKDGLCTRLVTYLTQKANEYKCTIRLKKGTREISAKSMLCILALGIKQGEEFSLITDGVDEEAASEALCQLLESSADL